MTSNDLNIEINKLTQAYNNSLSILSYQFKQNINIINRSRLSIRVKQTLIKNITTNYNNNVKRLTNEYNIKKKNIIDLFSKIPPSNKKMALLIGINYINTPDELYGCINDSNNIKDLLQSKFNYDIFNILTDNTNTKPTKQNIINELTKLLVNANNGDSIFFSYSGHGTYTIDLNNDENDGYDEMIVPIDAHNIKTCILDDEINSIITKNLKGGVKLFMLFDSCFSGSVVDLKYNYLTTENDINSLIINPQGKDTIGQVIMISGSKDDQTSADTYVKYFNNNINSGAMTYSFLKTIHDLGINISLEDLIKNMRIILKENEFSQIPQLSSGTLIDISSSILSL